jgi:hypothetical protein
MSKGVLVNKTDEEIIKLIQEQAYRHQMNYRGCSQVQVKALTDHLGFFTQDVFRAATPFAAGVARKGEQCGHLTGAIMVTYGVSKAAIERFTWGAATVGKFNIAVNCVKPGESVRTEGMELLNPDANWSQWDDPDMMVRAVLFLARQNASGVTGLVAPDEEICAWHGLLQKTLPREMNQRGPRQLGKGHDHV